MRDQDRAPLSLRRRQARTRHNLITFNNAFHGRTMATISATDQPKMIDGFAPLLPGFTVVEFDNLDAALAAVDDNTAGFLLEPIQGEGGIRPASKEFIHGLRKVCDEHDLMLVFDEVQCGVARTGYLYAYEYYGVTPDIMSTAKGIGGGFPLGACLATEKAARGHGHRHPWFDLWRQPAGDGRGAGGVRHRRQ